MQLSMFSAEELPVRTPASDTQQALATPDLDWMARVLASPSPSPESWSGTGPVGSSGRMLRMSFQPGTPEASSASPRALSHAGIMSPGECWTSAGSGPPISHERASSWSDIVTLDAPQRYYLSPRALAGIANRKRKPRLFSPRGGGGSRRSNAMRSGRQWTPHRHTTRVGARLRLPRWLDRDHLPREACGRRSPIQGARQQLGSELRRVGLRQDPRSREPQHEHRDHHPQQA